MDLGGLLDERRGQAVIVLLGVLLVGGSAYAYLASMIPLSEGTLEMVSGTEYISGEEGQIIVRLSADGEAIEGAQCNASLLYPDKSYVFIDRAMNETTIAGNYYVSFTTPATEGIYEERIVCEASRNGEREVFRTSDSFHVSPGLNMIQEMSRSQREQYENLSDSLQSSRQRLLHRIKNLSERVNRLEKKTKNMTRGVEEQLNESVERRFDELNERFADTAEAMEEAFR